MKENKILSFLFCLALLLSFGIRAEAVSPQQPDYGRVGSVTVTIRTADGTPVPGGTLTIYRVADAVRENGDNRFVFTEAFQNCGVNLSDLAEESSGAPELASALAAFASSNKLKGTSVSIDSNGTAAFPDLTLGLYLIVQDKPADGYEAVLPFLVTVPFWDGEELLYDVDASPKPSTVAKVSPPPTPTPTPPPGKKLPQTGQLWWPVPVLAALGILTLALGLFGKKKHEE